MGKCCYQCHFLTISLAHVALLLMSLPCLYCSHAHITPMPILLPCLYHFYAYILCLYHSLAQTQYCSAALLSHIAQNRHNSPRLTKLRGAITGALLEPVISKQAFLQCSKTVIGQAYLHLWHWTDWWKQYCHYLFCLYPLANHTHCHILPLHFLEYL